MSAIDRRFIGYALPAFTVLLEPQRLQRFARAVGMADAQSLSVIPPTFFKAIEGEDNSSRRIIDALGVPLQQVLHVEQQFDYLLPITVGEQVRVERKVADIYEKKGGAMQFIVIESSIFRGDAQLAGRSRQIVLVRRPALASAA